MALTLGSASLFAASLLVAAAALFWPQLETLYLQSDFHGVNKANGTKCPLGYEGPMPSNHPPIGTATTAVQPAKAAVATSAVTDTPKNTPAAASVTVLGSRSDRPQYVFVNGNIWTANTEAKWASSMAVDAATGEITQITNTADNISHSSTGSSSSSSSCTARSSSSSSTTEASAGSCSTVAADVLAVDVPPGSTIIDLQGAFVMPAFVDPHVHLIPGGLAFAHVDLRGVSSRADLAARLAAAAAAAADGSWLVGWGWSEADWGGDLPHAAWIDEACAGHPAFLTRMDSHMALVNTVALNMANLRGSSSSDGCGCSCGNYGGQADNADAAEVVGGFMDGVDTDAHGRPTGLLREHAMSLVRSLIPPPTLQQRKAALTAASQYLLSRGVTSVGDMGWGLFGGETATWEDLERIYDAAAEEGELPLRISSYVPLRTWQRAVQRVQSKGFNHSSGRLVWGGVKEFADGSLGSSTAAMWRPYADSNGSNAGMWSIELDELQTLINSAAEAGLQVAVHAIGDRAVDEVLMIFEQLDECDSTAGPCMQHRIEHAQHISGPVTAAKLSVLNLHAVPNPQHLISDIAMLVPKLGLERAGAGRSHAYRTLAAMGVSMGFASDWPVVDIDPFASIHAAVFRHEPPEVRSHQGLSHRSIEQNPSSQMPQPPPKPPPTAWAPEEKIPLEVALQLHTHTAAKVARLDSWVGQLKPGLKADFVVLDRSPFEGLGLGGGEGFGAGMPTVVKTYMDGKCVFGCEGASILHSASSVLQQVVDSVDN